MSARSHKHMTPKHGYRCGYDCAFCDQRAYTMVGGTGLCERHAALLVAIQADAHVDPKRAPRFTRRKPACV